MRDFYMFHGPLKRSLYGHYMYTPKILTCSCVYVCFLGTVSISPTRFSEKSINLAVFQIIIKKDILESKNDSKNTRVKYRVECDRL